MVDRSGNVGEQLRPNHVGPFLIALTESWKEDCKCYGSSSESDLKRIEETASCAISIHSSFLTIRDVVLDTIGGETQQRSWSVLRRGGILISIVSPVAADKATSFGVRGAFFIVEPNR